MGQRDRDRQFRKVIFNARAKSNFDYPRHSALYSAVLGSLQIRIIIHVGKAIYYLNVMSLPSSESENKWYVQNLHF